MSVNSWIRGVVDLLMPDRCHLCGEDLLEGEEVLCGICRNLLPLTNYHKSSRNPVELRFAGKFKFEEASSCLFYAPHSRVASLIQDFKYRNYPDVARSLGRMMGEMLGNDGWLDGMDVVCPVPLHWWKEMKRGYSQTHELALGLSEATGIPVSDDLRTRRRHKSQTGFDHAGRMKNTQNLFRLHRPELYEGKRVLLLDDVCTTGATMTSAADAILEAAPTVSLRLLTLAATF